MIFLVSMGGLGLLDRVLGVVSLIEKQIGKRVRDFSEFAATHPAAAAEQLDLVAMELEARANSRRRQRGFITRRLRARAKGFRQHAEDLRDRANNRMCIRNPYRELGK